MIVTITLTIAGDDVGPFDLYSNIDGFTTPFETGVTRASLVSGYTSTVVPNYTAIIRAVSSGVCSNYLDIVVGEITTTTSTTSTTTTLVPVSFNIDWSQGVGTLGMNSTLSIYVDSVNVVNSIINYNLITDTNYANGIISAYPGQQIDIYQEGQGYSTPGIMVLQATYGIGITDTDTDTSPYTTLSFIMPNQNFLVLAQVNS